MKRSKILWSLLLDFLRYGCFTFGGGWSIIAQMQQKYVETEKSMTAEELLDLTSVAKSLPGTMIANVAMLYGYRVAGFAGGLVAVFSMILPPMVILIGICFFYDAFRNNFWVSAAMSGMQAAVVPIIGSAALGMAKGSVKYPPCVLVMLLCMGLYLFTQVNAFVLVLTGIVSGFLIGGYYERKEAKTHGAA